jgi:hypothetical protein
MQALPGNRQSFRMKPWGKHQSWQVVGVMV